VTTGRVASLTGGRPGQSGDQTEGVPGPEPRVVQGRGADQSEGVLGVVGVRLDHQARRGATRSGVLTRVRVYWVLSGCACTTRRRSLAASQKRFSFIRAMPARGGSKVRRRGEEEGGGEGR